MVYCILAYPVLVHLSVVLGQPPLAGAALVALYAGFAFGPLARRNAWAWAGLVLAAVLAALIVRQGATLYALYLPPIVLPAALLAWWAPTLRAGQVPFVTRLARAIRGPLSAEHAAYTRGVTVMWVVVFGLLTVVGAACALWASPALWSLVTNVGNTLFLGLVFVAEYLYRRWHLRHEAHPGFVTFLRQLARAGVRPGSP
jgi:uncharacterized membrane protein